MEFDAFSSSMMPALLPTKMEISAENSTPPTLTFDADTQVAFITDILNKSIGVRAFRLLLILRLMTFGVKKNELQLKILSKESNFSNRNGERTKLFRQSIKKR